MLRVARPRRRVGLSSEHMSNLRLGYKRLFGRKTYSIMYPGVFLTRGQAQKYARTRHYRGFRSRVVKVVMGGKNVGFAVYEIQAKGRTQRSIEHRRRVSPSLKR